MRAGKLDQFINIFRKDDNASTVTPTGSQRTFWRCIGSDVRAEIVKQSASEFLTGFGQAEARTVIFRIRWRPNLTTAHRITHCGVTYDVKEIAEIGRQRGLELRAVAVT